MITEIAILNLRQGMEADFEKAFIEAEAYIRCQKGYIEHQLKKCLETEGQYLLLVNWETLEDHTIGFRESSEYQQWRALLHHFYDPFPTVEHYQSLV